MPEPLVPPEFQYCDANGVPYAGGTITTYIPGTDTFKSTWSDMAGTALQTNPIVLDAAGRALIYGDGEYRFVLRDSVGNLIYDQLTTSFISDAMKAVVQADSISAALDLLGVTDAIQAETDRAIAAESALTGNINTLTTNLNNEVTRATTAENTIKTAIGGAFQTGFSITNSSGYDGVTFPQPYATGTTPTVMLQVWYNALVAVTFAVTTAPNGFEVWASEPDGVTPASLGYQWLSYGTLA